MLPLANPLADRETLGRRTVSLIVSLLRLNDWCLREEFSIIIAEFRGRGRLTPAFIIQFMTAGRNRQAKTSAAGTPAAFRVHHLHTL
jgi:hypothetical protein